MPSSLPLRAIYVTGITSHLVERLEQPLLVKLAVDGNSTTCVLLKREEESVAAHSFHKPLIFPEGSALRIQVQETCRNRSRNRRQRVLADLEFSVEDIWKGPDPGASDRQSNSKRYCIRFGDPTKEVWLNVELLPISQRQLGSIAPGGSSPCSSKVTHTSTLVPEQLKGASDSALRHLRALKRASDGLGRAERLATVVQELNPTATSVLTCVKAVCEQFDTHNSSCEDILTLAEGMTRSVNHIQQVKGITEMNKLKKSMAKLRDLMWETSSLIETWLKRAVLANVALSPLQKQDIDNLILCYTTFETEFDQDFMIDESRSLTKSQDLKELKDTLLEGIKTVEPRATECIPGTRTAILADIATKADDGNVANVIWIHGAPGSGKSSLSLSEKSRLRRQGRLVTYFRFDRNEATTTTSTALWRRVAYDLACRLPSTRTRLLEQIRDDTADLDLPLAVFTSLVEESLLESDDHLPDRPFVIIIDALDECGGTMGRLSADRKLLLQTVERWQRKLPRCFKLLVTSREESDIGRVLSSISERVEIPSGRSLVENPHAEASIHAARDIRMFLERRFSEIRQRVPSLPADWPGTNTMNDMVYSAAGIFMWATTAANFIDVGLDPIGRLRKIMGNSPSKSNGMKPLYSLYATILEISFGHISASESVILQSVLGVMVLSKRPLQDSEYTKLSTAEPVTVQMLDSIRDGLRSVVAPDSLRFVHKSFDDFLVSDECPPRFRIKLEECQYLLTKLCLTTMSAELRFNICGLETSCLRNADVPEIEAKVMNCIPSCLSYACSFWAYHLSLTPFDEELMGEVKAMMLDKMLYWFEVMSLLKKFHRASHSLLLVLQWSHTSPDDEFKDFLRDARRFVGAFGHPIAQSVPHIYISALSFAPQKSLVARHFLPRFPNVFLLSSGQPADWPICIFTAEHHIGPVRSVVFSPDERYFASGSDDGTVCICDSETGNLSAGPFRPGNDYKVQRVIFDPDGHHVLAECRRGGQPGRVICWNIHTGDKQFEVSEERAIGYSQFEGRKSFISVSKSHIPPGQATISWRNAETGERLGQSNHPMKNGLPPIIKLSPDGSHIVWGDQQSEGSGIVKLLDGRIQPISIPFFESNRNSCFDALSFAVDNGNFAVSTLSHFEYHYDKVWFDIVILDLTTNDIVGPSLRGSTSAADVVAYCHEKGLILSGSRSGSDQVEVWNAYTQEAVLGPLVGHTSKIVDIVLSRDGRRVLTSSMDKTLRMWDLSRKGVPLSHATGGHQDSVYDIVFSPCGKKLASLGKDETIRVWDTRTGKSLLNPISLAESSGYTRITFSPDGSQLMVSSPGCTAQMWDVGTGELNTTLHLGINAKYTCFRSTDQRLVACSNDGVVRIWIWNSRPMTYHLSTPSRENAHNTECAKILSHSPDGSTVVVCDDNRNPRHYIWSTMKCKPLPLEFVDDECISGDEVVCLYLPSGRFFAAFHTPKSGDASTLRVWSTQTGELAAGPSILDSNIRCFAFSPDDRHVAFVYGDSLTLIWIWDFRNDRPASGPWVGHVTPIDILVFSLDGARLASTSNEGQIRIWNTSCLRGDLEHSFDAIPAPTHMRNGWVIDEDGQLLFWVPRDHREALYWGRNEVVMGGRGIPTRLEFTRFRYGQDWAMECTGDVQQSIKWKCGQCMPN